MKNIKIFTDENELNDFVLEDPEPDGRCQSLVAEERREMFEKFYRGLKWLEQMTYNFNSGLEREDRTKLHSAPPHIIKTFKKFETMVKEFNALLNLKSTTINEIEKEAEKVNTYLSKWNFRISMLQYKTKEK